MYHIRNGLVMKSKLILKLQVWFGGLQFGSLISVTLIAIFSFSCLDAFQKLGNESNK